MMALFEYALDETVDRLAEAELDNVSFREGIARIARAFVALRSKYAVLTKIGGEIDKEAAVCRLKEPTVENV